MALSQLEERSGKGNILPMILLRKKKTDMPVPAHAVTAYPFQDIPEEPAFSQIPSLLTNH